MAPQEQIEDTQRAVAKARERYQMYLDRYGLGTDRALRDLEETISRRQFKVRHLNARLRDLGNELTILQSEISGLARGLNLLLNEEIDRIRSEFGETWSPFPVLGFRLWSNVDDKLHGAVAVWPTPRQDAICYFKPIDGADLPHTDGRCDQVGHGCGIYVTKSVAKLLDAHIKSAQTDFVVGLVALSGKVVEHEFGYRGARATVMAVSAITEDGMATSADPTEIDSLFASPLETLAEWQYQPNHREGLVTYMEGTMKWISEVSSG